MAVERFNLILADDVFTVVDDGNATAADYQSIERTIEHHFETRRRAKMGAIIVVPRGAAIPSSETRKEIKGVFTRLAPKLAAVAHVIEERGFHGAANRGVLTGLLMFERKPYEMAVFADVNAALRWLGPHVALAGTKIESLTGLLSSISSRRAESLARPGPKLH